MNATKDENLYDQCYLNGLFQTVKTINYDYNEMLCECLRDDFKTNEFSADITVVIPTYKRIDSIRRAIECLKKQEDAAPFSILIICDDPEPSQIDDFVLKLDLSNIIYYKNKKNLGVFGNWNLGVFLSGTKWVTVLCDDDYLYPDYMKTVQRLIRDNPEKKYFLTNYDIAQGNSVEEITKQIKKHEKMYLQLGGNNAYEKQNRSRRHNLSFCDYALIEQLYKIPLGDVYQRESFLKVGGMQQRFYPAGDCAMILRYMNYIGGLFYYYGRAGCISVGMNESVKPENMEKSRSQVATMRMISLSRTSVPFKFLVKKEIELSAKKIECNSLLLLWKKVRWKILRVPTKLMIVVLRHIR